MNRQLFLCDEDYKRKLFHRQCKLDPGWERERKRSLISFIIGLVGYSVFYGYTMIFNALESRDRLLTGGFVLFVYIMLVPFYLYFRGKQRGAEDLFSNEKDNLEISVFYT